MGSENISNEAIASFRSGLNCAQAVLVSFCEKYQTDRNTALKLACGFGGGMGRLQQTCGAVTGAFMVFGLHNCQKYTDNKERKEQTYSMIQEFDKRFKAIHGTTNCYELLKVDLKTEEGHEMMKVKNLGETVCEKCITDSVEIIGSMV